MVIVDDLTTITLTQDAVFQPECTGLPMDDRAGDSSVLDMQDPFYASTLPQIYAIAAATVIAYMLVIMLFITPRTFFIGGAGGGFLGRRGILRGASGSTSIVGVGGRPWLQKVAALTVAISLTIATVDTFKVAEDQYVNGYQDSAALTQEVVGGLSLRVVRVVSDTFLWLAQVQTLIRLFPRHREKVIIKWAGFALIVLDTIFSILNKFVNESGKTSPRRFVDAIPALSYLFQLSLSLLYAAWVIFYSLERRRFAFFHYKMRNIILVAILSLTAVLIPVVFFVLDISKPTVAGWGDYVRWVGAAAASVVVWEWVERIEALEREERKDGILGREIFDGDEMLEITPSSEVNWPGSRHDRPKGGRGNGSANASGRSRTMDTEDAVPRSRAPSYAELSRQGFGYSGGTTQRPAPNSLAVTARVPCRDPPTPPPAIASPISRGDTTSATSTEYAVHYHPVRESTSPGLSTPSPRPPLNAQVAQDISGEAATAQSVPLGRSTVVGAEERAASTAAATPATNTFAHRLRNTTNPFKRRRTSPPPPEISQARTDPSNQSLAGEARNDSKLSARKFNPLERLRTRKDAASSHTDLPVMIIPAQPRGRIWSPTTVEENTSSALGDEETGTVAGSSTVVGRSVHSATSPEENGSSNDAQPVTGARPTTLRQQSGNSPPEASEPNLPIRDSLSVANDGAICTLNDRPNLLAPHPVIRASAGPYSAQSPRIAEANHVSAPAPADADALTPSDQSFEQTPHGRA